MPQAAVAAPDALKQLVAECRDQPVMFEAVRPDLCPSLELSILERMKRDHGRKTGSLNVGGWKSGEDVFAWSDPTVQELRRVVVDIVGARNPVAWAMVNRAGSYHPRHQHRIAVLSGVYYVNAGDPNVVTPTVFECPCDGRPKQQDVEIDPHPGRMIICRGETWHSVPRYMGESPRITIAFDVRR